MNTTGNVFLLTAASAMVGAGVATIEANLLTGAIEILLGAGLFFLYEKFPN